MKENPNIRIARELKEHAKGAEASAKGKQGRPKLNITADKVEKLARIHCTIPEIAAVLGCSEQTIRGRFLASLRKGRRKGCRSLRRKQYETAMEGNPTMLIWMGKQMLKQKDKQEHQVAGSGGGPLRVEITYVDASQNAKAEADVTETALRTTSSN